MISDALTFIKEELSQYLVLNSTEDDFAAGFIILGNISQLETDQVTLDNKVILSLVNVEEESVFKNMLSTRKNPFTGGVEYLNPPVYLNLYILISCTLPAEGEKYRKALARLSLVIQFFQNKKIFTLNNSPNTSFGNDPNMENLKIIMDLYTLTFEQINHLWGSLGGKQVPFVMYKARLVQIEDEQLQSGGNIITEIQGEAAGI